ncbi:hypothetical protein GCM10011584_34200 [Nocardioides phosphati]|uniref:DUF6998 domain-containing protein n=1 Tax=Nocardioides phosphati TaxID=1867775 RepID=A0ABQ2NFG0_9ACTN|nr:hypothetical protein [Nocardioides phosphati]GGO94052.1 hypothetical protein GCM10011584_34200 [Nocardioides phosphati]
MSTEIAGLVTRLYEIVAELEALHEGRHFTPDGHLVGSIGEVLAAAMFGLELMPASNKSYDAKLGDQTVEIKATQGNGISLQAHFDTLPDFLVALRIERDGSANVIYNGPAAPVWEAAGEAAKNGQRRIGISRLRALQEAIPEAQRLSPVLQTTPPI